MLKNETKTKMKNENEKIITMSFEQLNYVAKNSNIELFFENDFEKSFETLNENIIDMLHCFEFFIDDDKKCLHFNIDNLQTIQNIIHICDVQFENENYALCDNYNIKCDDDIDCQISNLFSIIDLCQFTTKNENDVKSNIEFLLSNNHDISQIKIARDILNTYFNQTNVDDVDEIICLIDTTIESLIETNDDVLITILNDLK